MSSNKGSSGSTRIAIVGAGLGGISFAIALQRKFPGFKNFIIYEKGSDVGGTWRVNTYPGCSCDVPVHFYSLSTDLKPDWDHTHAYQPQIQQYWQELALKYDIYPHVQFDTLVTSVEWDSESQCYEIITKHLSSDEQTRSTAEIVISALGLLEVTNFPDIAGIKSFKGEIFHSGKWDHKVKLAGKRVAVIGNGASATQFIPVISQDPSVNIVNFVRTPNWFIYPLRSSYSTIEKSMFKYIPLWMRVYRTLQFLRTDFLYLIVFKFAFARRISTAVRRGSSHSLSKSHSFAAVRTAERNSFHGFPNPHRWIALGCKRIIIDTDYLTSLHRLNVSMNFDGINCISEDGIVTNEGSNLPFDVIICATGFTVDEFPLHVKGTRNTMQEYYNTQGGPTAYLGTAVPGFPNFFMLGGPNVTTGHTSVIFTEENQIGYILKLITPIINHPERVRSIGVTSQATDKFNSKLHAALQRSVFVKCLSWYRTDKSGKVFSVWPYSAMAQWG
ncbi:hypothetical protein D9757_001318 [Collybiopsis confluens]|uniref:Uncharacterized protein n=1 Tax=Collybiopsis confluens TaxID=2823264 RepID=A0A8H5I0W2_9AGAR|nr:hypothetical protein D9757_001318 [Collybiopsis confluens]